MIDFNIHKGRFSNFVDGFGSKDPGDQENITLKKNHSLRVFQEAKSLTQGLDAPAEYIQLARLTGLPLRSFHPGKKNGFFRSPESQPG